MGLGGLQARLTETAAFRLPPATDTEADELIDSAKGVAEDVPEPGTREPAIGEILALFAAPGRFAPRQVRTRDRGTASPPPVLLPVHPPWQMTP